MTLEDKKNELTNYLRSLKKVAIGCSGGVDSLLLATMAIEVLGVKNVLLLHIKSDFSIESETNSFIQLVQSLQCQYKVIEIYDILSDVEIAENSPQRCYFCKKRIMKLIRKEAELAKIHFVADGTNVDDFNDYRPGMRATKELNIIHPFVVCKFNKELIRELAAELNLDVANRPSNSCLATRIPYYVQLHKDILNMTHKAENFLKKLGVYNCRVRYFDGAANIAVDEGSIELIFKKYQEVCSFLKSLGYDDVAINLTPYQNGDLNRKLRR